MRLIKEAIAVMFGGSKLPKGDAAPKDAEEAAWSEYHSSWEMDPPPDPRAVFLAGYRAGQDQQQ